MQMCTSTLLSTLRPESSVSSYSRENYLSLLGSTFGQQWCDLVSIFVSVECAMSGFEAAGLALAILPLILSAAKHYDSVLCPFRRYTRFAKEAKTYSKELGIQRTIFRNECRNLLKEVIDHDTASSMFNLLPRET